MSREEDALIAEKVFGWVWACGRYAGKVPSHYFLVPPSELEGSTTIRPCSPPKERVGVYVEAPAYTSDAAADYSVLEKVRCDKQLFRTDDLLWFERKLHGYYMERWAKIDDGDSMLSTLQLHILFYQVGDYTRAALEVLKAKGEA